MKIEELAFPLTVEAFTAIQESLVGKPPHNSWIGVMEELVPEINAAYECHDREVLDTVLGRLDAGISRFSGDRVFVHTLKAVKFWFVYAWERGCRDHDVASGVVAV